MQMTRNDSRLQPEEREAVNAALNSLEKLLKCRETGRRGIVVIEAAASFGEVDSLELRKDGYRP
jgi:hypothetical protein